MTVLATPATDQPTRPTGSPRPTDPDRARTPRLRAQVSRPHQDALVVTVSGDVDAATIEHLQEVLWPRLSATVHTLVVDLTEVGFLGMAGLDLLHQARLWAHARGLALGLVLAGGEAERAVHMARLDKVLPCFPTTEHAVHVLDGRV